MGIIWYYKGVTSTFGRLCIYIPPVRKEATQRQVQFLNRRDVKKARSWVQLGLLVQLQDTDLALAF